MIDNTNSSSTAMLREILAQKENTLVLVKREPSKDLLAAATALYLSLIKAGKRVTISCPTETLVEHASLVGINKITKIIPTTGADLTIVLPYQKGKVEKISYNIEGDSIHLVVKAGKDGLGFDTNDIKFAKSGIATSEFVFLIGVQNPFADLEGLYNEDLFQNAKIVNIPNDFTGSSASSVSETVASLLQGASLPIDTDIAANLIQGIKWATNNFQSDKTSPLAFEMTGLLMRYGVRRPVSQEQGQVQAQDSSSVVQEIQKDNSSEEPPQDWLTPKIYKGSTLP